MTLLDECIEVLGADTEIFTDSEKEKILDTFKSFFSFTEWGRIDWDKVSKKEDVNTVNDITAYLEKCYENFNTVVYVIWDEGTLPIIKTDLKKVLECIDDVTAVSFDTWIFSPSSGYVIEIYHEGEVLVGIR
ncbi:CDI toxin immunity protein [Thermoflavimicrobium dichotomicum]|uniref:Uncharacterized protein n=1 Tax=Thermoflavimicrobium dichotomicum TaxID=46223 RepID=A0A1I3P478_9BACL|nr:hypothetical protein [Thermoflavimicrobium dichotomicum]SFJ16140.1 hypothetical protein SAMN05421852_10578 [Thermoflavimicrobium dichotomicum]